MILQNYSLDQDKSFQNLLSLKLGYVYLAHCTLIWLKKTVKKLIYLILFFLGPNHNFHLQQAHEPKSQCLKGLILTGNVLY